MTLATLMVCTEWLSMLCLMLCSPRPTTRLVAPVTQCMAVRTYLLLRRVAPHMAQPEEEQDWR